MMGLLSPRQGEDFHHHPHRRLGHAVAHGQRGVGDPAKRRAARAEKVGARAAVESGFARQLGADWDIDAREASVTGAVKR
jgi:hypothetical protein